MKYLLVLAVLLIAFYAWRSGRQKPGGKSAPPRPGAPAGAPSTPVDMVRCAVCGVHLPENEAVHGRVAVYCGAAHRLAAEN